MVGRLASLSNKQLVPRVSQDQALVQPPPPYDHSSNPPVIVAETTTTRTEVVTTTTTTHFFSLPLWRKRGPASSNSARQSTFEVNKEVDEHGLVAPSPRTSSYMDVEKDLPPTPPDGADRESNKPSPGASEIWQGQNLTDVPRSASPISCSPLETRMTSSSLPAIQPTAALARASLGLGLRHVVPQVSASSSSSEINTVAFAKPEEPSQARKRSISGIRRTKSAQKLMSILSPDRSTPTDIPSVEDGAGRIRGTSFSASSFLHLGNTDMKGKGHDKNASADPSPLSAQTFPKALARKSSFWSRKKAAPETVLSTSPHPLSTLQLTMLPPPISPFNMDITFTPSSPTPSHTSNSRVLSRSHSARTSLRSIQATKENNSDTPNRTRRPATAGSSAPQSTSASATLSAFSLLNQDPRNPPPADSCPPQPRARAYTNPPLLNRLSWNIFSHPSTSSSVPPMPRSHTNSYSSRPPASSSSSSSINGRKDVSRSLVESQVSTESPRSSFYRKAVPIPVPSGNEESPEIYLRRLQAAVSKAEVAGILASSADAFYAQALRTYIGQFNFASDPLDIALRKLLMEVGLPRETQQIDRVMEAFAGRYLTCNPSLFISEDHPYILAFSLIMLHTDAFNKSNKHKMSKADYIKNTRLPGVAPEVLDCFYDNIIFAPFIFVEDPLDVNGQRGLLPEAHSSQVINSGGNLTGMPTRSNTGLSRVNRVDLYYLITNDLLGPLRVDVDAYVPTENPYSYEGTAGSWDETQLQLAFAKASEIEIGASDNLRSPFFSRGSGPGLPTPDGAASRPAASSTGNAWTLKVTKVGLLNRKDDVLEGGKKASNRKWKPYSVVLTGSQLLFFRDPSWASSLLAVQSTSSGGQLIFPQSAMFKPDELVSVKDAIAVFDRSYTKHENIFRFVLADGRQLLLQTANEKELNEWIAGVNYASAFKSAGVRMRPLDMSGTDVKLTGVAAATSHLHDLQHQNRPKSHAWDRDAPRELMGMLSGDSELNMQAPPAKRKLTIVTDRDDMDLDVPVAPEIDGAEQFKATFDQVKADLAAGRWAPLEDETSPFPSTSSTQSADSLPSSSVTARSESARLPSRTQIIQTKIEDLESRISGAQSQLDASMRFVRNIATLTPFQKSTRDRLVAAVRNVAHRVAQVRLEIAKLVCHRSVLLNDLASEERSWQRAKTIALRAATETLHSRRSGNLPRMTISFHTEPLENSPSPAERSSYHRDTSLSQSRPESSICESFHSVPDWPSSEDLNSSDFLDAGHLVDSPMAGSSGYLNSYPFPTCESGSPKRSLCLPSNTGPQSGDTSPRTSGDMDTHERFYTAQESPEELAERWDQTRCAQRVSLVRLPSDIQLTTRLRRRSGSKREALNLPN